MRPIGLIFLVALVVELSLKFHFQTGAHKKNEVACFLYTETTQLTYSGKLSNSFIFSMENYIVGRHYFSNLHICKFYDFLRFLGFPAHCEAD